MWGTLVFPSPLRHLTIFNARVAIPPAIYRAPKPGFPKTAAETVLGSPGLGAL